MEIFGFSKEMTSHVAHMAGQVQAQAEARCVEAEQREEAQRAEAKQREEAQRAEAERREEARRAEAEKREEVLRVEAMKREELALTREQMIIQMKTVTDQTSADREKAQIEANQKREQAQLEVTQNREQLLMQHELKRQKMLVDANTTLLLKMDVNREVANLEALERREAEFEQLQEKEKERAREAQIKLRELAAQELKERVHLERELVKQQQQNLLLQKQKEIERLEAQVDRNLFSQAQVSSGKQATRGNLAQVPEEVETSSPETATIELGDSDSPPPPSQNRPRPVRRTPAVASVGVLADPAPVSKPIVSKVEVPVVSPALGVATGVPLPSSEGPLIIPRGPEVVATPLPVASPVVGAQQVHRPVSAKPLDVVSHLSAGLSSYTQRYVAPPVPMPTCVPGSMMPVPAAPPLYTGVMPTCSPPMLPSGIVSAPPSSVAVSVPIVAFGTDTRSTFVSLGVALSSVPPIVDTKLVPAASVVTSTGAPPTSQEPAGAGTGQSSATVVPAATPPAPTVVAKQPEPVRPYTGTTSYKAYNEYFERICVCNDWKTPTECARHLLVAMNGAAPEAVRGLKAEQDSDLATIWEALARRFGFVDEPERAMRRFDVRKQLEGEILAVFEQSLRMLHREAWPKTDIK